jgi:DNA-binding PadR family transcriptional regulator
MRAEELKGHLDALLLAALEDSPRHGYAVIEALRHSTGGRLDLPTGTIYPALHRLEQAGLTDVLDTLRDLHAKIGDAANVHGSAVARAVATRLGQ